MSDQQPTTTQTDTQPAAATEAGGVTYYYDDNALFRERAEWGYPEVLNGDKWEWWPDTTSRMSRIDEAEAQQLAGDVPLDAPNASEKPGASGKDAGDGEG
jgi:hypothetical protein